MSERYVILIEKSFRGNYRAILRLPDRKIVSDVFDNAEDAFSNVWAMMENVTPRRGEVEGTQSDAPIEGRVSLLEKRMDEADDSWKRILARLRALEHG